MKLRGSGCKFGGRLAVAWIHRTWREVRPCRVRLASLTDRADFPLFLTDEEQFAVVEQPALRTCRERLWDGEIEGQRVQV